MLNISNNEGKANQNNKIHFTSIRVATIKERKEELVNLLRYQ